jgi:sulfur carrier protein ThiS adenylyltransferase
VPDALNSKLAEALRTSKPAGTAAAGWSTTLFAAGEAYAGPCTAKSTIYCANIAAGMMLAQFAKWLRALPTEPDVTVNLLACELA